MPEAIRLKVGGVTQQQMAVYEEFARNIPGFLPLNDRDFLLKPSLPLESQPPPQPHPSTPFQGTSVLAPEDVIGLYEKLIIEVEQFIHATNGQTAYTVMNNNMQIIREALYAAFQSREFVAGATIIQKVPIFFKN